MLYFSTSLGQTSLEQTEFRYCFYILGERYIRVDKIQNFLTFSVIEFIGYLYKKCREKQSWLSMN